MRTAERARSDADDAASKLASLRRDAPATGYFIFISIFNSFDFDIDFFFDFFDFLFFCFFDF